MDNVNKINYDLIGLNELDEHINDIYNLIYKTELIKDIVSEYKYYSKSFLANTQKYLNQLQIERFNILTKIRALFINELYNKGFQEMNNDPLIYFKRAYNWIIKHYRFTDSFFEIAKQNCLYEIKNALIDKIAKYVNSKVLSYLLLVVRKMLSL